MKYIFAGDRQISLDILTFLINKGFKPSALLLREGKNASHSQELINISGLESHDIIWGTDFKTDININKLRELEVDYIFGIHFPYIIPREILDIPKTGFLNLHPAYLPFNKGWHTPSWAILDGSPYGATLHFMSEELDEGAIIHQKRLGIDQKDTANSLYQKVLKLEYDVFVEAYPDLLALKPKMIKQLEIGTAHFKKDLDAERIIDLDDIGSNRRLLDKLRALTTNDQNELAYFIDGNKKVGVKISFIELDK